MVNPSGRFDIKTPELPEWVLDTLVVLSGCFSVLGPEDVELLELVL
jgi:hypothetical protein